VTWLDSLFKKDKLKRETKVKVNMDVKNAKTVLGTLQTGRPLALQLKPCARVHQAPGWR